MSPRFVTLVLFSIVAMIACSVQNVAAMQGELRIYKEPEFKRLRRIIGVSINNLCYDMPCVDLSDITSSAKWTGLPATGSSLADGQAKIAFYRGNNCTGKVVVLNTNLGQVQNFADLGMSKSITSFAVLKTSTQMEHATSNVCQW